jgi:hypothetical protein
VLGCYANVLRPQAGHIPPSHPVNHLGSLGQGLRLRVGRYARVVYEYLFASIIRTNIAVPTLAVVPAPDGSRSLVQQFQSAPLSLGFLVQQKRSLGAVYENWVG